ncbi:hypothetical protein HYPBUDRAFT_158024 [Hyphopichia burtonii NRRL Y-1933]|uniref:DUF7702 domain-containing protein n=1 Tax=Hyphopichia burtonii NRRL Y-1933 TaxID=984485 RepID=A0A1E4RFG2_9ASCO|nr:hypothetical protein HYPBUDRAFT_158024 [Hyphopichia burtonii NRRL Y-1933]ODV65983.1 hypothetical protein HYPBUDRAFT_158024 [Hyphopichia burtonii NRRL Y-1933]
MFKLESSGIAGSVYLVLFCCLLPVTVYCTLKKGYKSVFTLLLIYNLIRLGGQVCGVLFGYYGFSNTDCLIAYIILGAEGYFSLILSSLYTIVEGQRLVKGRSWLKDYGPRGAFDASQKKRFGIRSNNWYGLYHLILIPANALLIAGASMTSGLSIQEYLQNGSKLQTSKSLRCAGQAIFLALTIVMVVIALSTFFIQRVRCWTMITVILASPFLIVRGIFGILSIYIDSMNYMAMSNYIHGGVFGILSIYIDDMNYMAMTNYLNGFHSTLIIYEYILGTSMEFVSAIFLVSAYFDKQRVPELSREDLFETICKNEY